MADEADSAASLDNLPLFAEPTDDMPAGRGISWAEAQSNLSPVDGENGGTPQRTGRDPARRARSRRRTYTDDEIDWALVRAFRQQAADQLAAALRDREGLDEAGRRELGRSIVVDMLADHADEALTKGIPTIGTDYQIKLAEAIFDSLFGLGRLQSLVDHPDIENIEINGYDNVHLVYSDGRIEQGPPVADSDEDLIETLSFFATRASTNERPFSPSNPRLHLRLHGGARLAATAWITPRPVAVIRRHRLTDITVSDLVDLDMMSPAAGAFLASAVRARKSIVVSGAQGAGKALALDTPIPTPAGWTTMGELRAGDEVFDEAGRACTVVHAHPVRYERPCFEVVLDDGEVIIADADHLWQVSRLTDRRRTARAKPPTYVLGHAERLQLSTLAERASEEPDRDMTIGDLVAEAGEAHRNVLRSIAEQLGPTGHVRKTWTGGRGAATTRDVLTYSRQRMLKELAVRRSTRGQAENLPGSVILTTAEIARNLAVAADKPWRTDNHVIELAGALAYPTKDQPVDPYVLGVWLGDGASSAARISTADAEVLAEFERLGYPCTKVGKSTYDYGVAGDLSPKLRALDLLGDKHIPRIYRFGDRDQRLALLQGLMDSDGTCNKRNAEGKRGEGAGSCEFSSSSEVLALQVREVVIGLGYTAHLRSKAVTFNGRPCGTSYTVSWTTRDSMFRLPRKIERQALCSPGPRGRAIVDVRPVESVPVRCITVDGASSLYLAGRSCVPTHNTTLIRALTNELDPMERIGTIETEYELHLHDMPERHKRIVAWESRPGSGERGPDGRSVGEITLDDLVFDSLRMNLSRLIVGEVRGKEVLPMFKAMQSGAGSLSTTHAHSARAAIERLVTCAMEAGQHVTEGFAYRQIAEHIDLIVQIELRDDSLFGGIRSRYVSEIVNVEPGEHGMPAVTDVFESGPDGHAVPGTPPVWLEDLEKVGFDPRLLDRGVSA